MVDVGGVPMVATGGYGNGDCWGGGGILGIILVIALLGGGLGFGGYGRGRDGCGGAEAGYSFALQKDVLENRFVSEKNTCAIVHNQDVCTGKILDKMTNIEMQTLREKISGLETALSEQRITATILTNLQPPRAIPSYPAPNPYAVYEQPRYGFPCGQPC